MTIRKEISNILGFYIGEDSWEDVWRASEIQGKMTGSRTNQILRILCERVEKLENEQVPVQSS